MKLLLTLNKLSVECLDITKQCKDDFLQMIKVYFIEYTENTVYFRVTFVAPLSW